MRIANNSVAQPVFLVAPSSQNGDTGNANASIPVSSAGYLPKGYQQFDNTQLATVQSLTVPAGATVAIIQNNHTQPMRWRDDGQNPTGTTGLRIPANSETPLTYDATLATFRMIKQTDGTGFVDVAYYG